MKRSRSLPFLLFVLVFTLVLRPPSVQAQQLTVQPGTGKQVVLSRSDIEALPHVKTTTVGSSGPVTFEGVTLKSVLEKLELVLERR